MWPFCSWSMVVMILCPKSYPFPETPRESCSFYNLHIQVALSCRINSFIIIYGETKEYPFKSCWVLLLEVKTEELPFSSLIVAYWLFARGQDDRLHSPVRLYSFLQKLWVLVLEWEEKSKDYKMGCQEGNWWNLYPSWKSRLTLFWRNKIACFLVYPR